MACSDLHGWLNFQVPRCDVLVIAGDLAPDAPNGLWQDPYFSKLFQDQWLADEYFQWEQSINADRIVFVPGNHDRFGAFPTTFRTEFLIDAGVTIQDMSFWFSPWVPQINGMWNYELDPVRRADRFNLIPEHVDVLVTHAPAKWCLDSTYSKENAGCAILTEQVKLKGPRYHLFGHIHEGQRYGREKNLFGRTTSINCARFLAKWKPVVIDL